MQPVSPALLDQCVLSKPYFDRLGLILAWEDNQPLGLVHAGFGPNEDRSALSTAAGVTCMLMVVPHEREQTVAAGLLAHSEEYLRQRGARVLYGGSIRPLDPFYLGLYGGSELPGVLVSDPRTTSVLENNGYKEVDRSIILQRGLSGYRPAVGRHRAQVRRSNLIEEVYDPPTESWWEACTLGEIVRTRFQIYPREGGPARGSATFWNIEPLAQCWQVHAAGLMDLEIHPPFRRQGLAEHLLAEAMRHLHSHGVHLGEVQVRPRNQAALGLYKKLGFQEVDQGAVFRKDT